MMWPWQEKEAVSRERILGLLSARTEVQIGLPCDPFSDCGPPFSDMTYLGVLVDHRLNNSMQYQAAVSKASKVLSLLKEA